jgi:hypothetical protein
MTKCSLQNLSSKYTTRQDITSKYTKRPKVPFQLYNKTRNAFQVHQKTKSAFQKFPSNYTRHEIPSNWTKRPNFPSKTCLPIIQKYTMFLPNTQNENCFPITQIFLPITQQEKKILSNDTKKHKTYLLLFLREYVEMVLYFGERKRMNIVLS